MSGLIDDLSRTLTTAQVIKWFGSREIEMKEHLVDCSRGNREAIESVLAKGVIPIRMLVERPEDDNKDLMESFV